MWELCCIGTIWKNKVRNIFTFYLNSNKQFFTSRGVIIITIIIIIIVILLLVTDKFANECIWYRLIFIKRVLTKDFKVVRFFLCLKWQGRAKTSSWCRIFSSRSRSRFESFLVYCFIVISILLNATFWQTSIQSQSVVNIL